jgi:hypothetical protein
MKITSNKSKRTYTIELRGNKYRTLPLSKAEFQEFEYNTLSDWAYYIRTNCVITL